MANRSASRSLAEEEQYVVAPAKDVRPVPKYSRRAQTGVAGHQRQQRGVQSQPGQPAVGAHAGRGIVHPLDMQHSDNPPVQSRTARSAGRRTGADEVRPAGVLPRGGAHAGLSAFEPEPEPGAAGSRSGRRFAGAGRRGRAKPSVDGGAAEAGRSRCRGRRRADRSLRQAHAAASTPGRRSRRTAAKPRRPATNCRPRWPRRSRTSTTKEDVHKSLVAAAQGRLMPRPRSCPRTRPWPKPPPRSRPAPPKSNTALAAARATVAEKTPQVQAASLKLAEVDRSAAPRPRPK